jgi:hypothetical protein
MSTETGDGRSAARQAAPEHTALAARAAVLPEYGRRVAPASEDSPGAERRAQRLAHPRLARELRTLRAMIRIYCRDHHGRVADGCHACGALASYAEKRLAACPFGADKPTCSNCVVHCYAPDRREQVKAVMRYTGPRMLLRHPVLAIAHVLDGRRPAPPKPRNSARR